MFTDENSRENVIIFGAAINSSLHLDDNGKDISILVEWLTQGLDDTTLTAEALYPFNFTQSGKWFVLSLHCNGNYNLLFVNTTKIY